MSSGSVESIIREVFKTEWDESVARVRNPNEDFDPKELPWVELRFPGADIKRADIGEPAAPMWDEAGAFMVHVFYPANAGTDGATSIADAVWDIFKGEEFSGIRCDERYSGQSGEREPVGAPGVWWGISYGIAYRYLSVG